MVLPKARPISCNDCPVFQRLHISALWAEESFPRLACTMNTTFSRKDLYKVVLHRGMTFRAAYRPRMRPVFIEISALATRHRSHSSFAFRHSYGGANPAGMTHRKEITIMQAQMGIPAVQGTFLPPIERPKGLIMKLVYAMTRRQFGKVITPLKVFRARLPVAFGQ